MKGCARSCLTGLIGLLVAIGLFGMLFERAGIRGDTLLGSAIGLGCLATLAISFLWSARGLAVHRRLLRNALEGMAPVDGQWAGFSGTIRSRSPLVAPLSGKPAVAFKYDVYVWRNSGKSRTKVTFYSGTALAPSTISTNLGSYKLLAVPQFDMAATDLNREDALRNLRSYTEATTFETRTPGQSGHRALEAEWTDDDGVYRRDTRIEEEPDSDNLKFDEQMIGQDQAVCVLGLYSQSRGGIVPDLNWAHQTRVVLGDGDQAARAISSRMRRYTMVALVLGSICVAITLSILRQAQVDLPVSFPMIRSYKGIRPRLAQGVYVDPSAQVIGDVELGEHASVWPCTVIRGDCHSIRIGPYSNIQDNSVVHVMAPDYPTVLGHHVTVGHNVVLHGCTIGDYALIGMGAIVLNGVTVGSESIIAAGTLVPERMQIPPGVMVMGSPAKVRRPLTAEEKAGLRTYAQNYFEYKNTYLEEQDAQ